MRRATWRRRFAQMHEIWFQAALWLGLALIVDTEETPKALLPPSDDRTKYAWRRAIEQLLGCRDVPQTD